MFSKLIKGMVIASLAITLLSACSSEDIQPTAVATRLTVVSKYVTPDFRANDYHVKFTKNNQSVDFLVSESWYNRLQPGLIVDLKYNPNNGVVQSITLPDLSNN